MDDDVMLTYKKKKTQQRVRCIGAIVFVILVFVIGFLIGYFAKKSGCKEHVKEPGQLPRECDINTINDTKKDLPVLQKRHEEMMSFHKQFQSTVNEKQLEKSLM